MHLRCNHNSGVQSKPTMQWLTVVSAHHLHSSPDWPGFFLGTIVGGDLVDRFKLHGKSMLFASLSSALLLTFLVPLVPLLPLLLIICLSQGIVLGIVDNVAQVLLIRLMEDSTQPSKVQPYMQALHAAFGVGGLLAPLIMAPFLGSEEPLIDPTIGLDIGGGSGAPAAGANSTASGTAPVVRTASGSTSYHYGYFIVCLLMLPVCVALARYMLRDEISWAEMKAFARSRWAALLQWARGRRGFGGRWSSVGGGEADGDVDGGGGGDGVYADEQLDNPSTAFGSAASRSPSSATAADAASLAVEVEMTATALRDESTLLSLDGSDEVGPQASEDADAVFRPPSATSESSPASAGRRDSQSLLAVSIAPPMAAPLHVLGAHTTVHVQSNGNGNGPSASPSEGGLVAPSPLSSVDLSPSPASGGVGTSEPGQTDWKMWRLVGLISLFLFLYVGCETGFASYIFSYGVRMVGMDPTHAAYLNSAFWLSFAAGRLVGIPVSLRFSATAMIFADLLGCIVSVLAIIIFHDNGTLLWVGTICYGVSVASIYPSAINFAETQFAVTGKVLSALTVSASLGDAVVPLLMGLSFSSPTGPLGLMLIAAGVAVGAAVIFAVIVAVAPRGRSQSSPEDAERKSRRKKKKRAAAAAAAAAAASSAAHAADEPSDAQLQQLQLEQDEEAALELGGARSDDYAHAPAASPKPCRSAYSVVDTDVDADDAKAEQHGRADWSSSSNHASDRLRSPIKAAFPDGDVPAHAPEL